MSKALFADELCKEYKAAVWDITICVLFAFELDEEGSGAEDESVEDLVKKRKSLVWLFSFFVAACYSFCEQ